MKPLKKLQLAIVLTVALLTAGPMLSQSYAQYDYKGYGSYYRYDTATDMVGMVRGTMAILHITLPIRISA